MSWRVPYQREGDINLDDADNHKGRLKHIGGSQSDHWNNVLVNQTVNTLWLKHFDKETRDQRWRDCGSAHWHWAER